MGVVNCASSVELQESAGPPQPPFSLMPESNRVRLSPRWLPRSLP